jgi:tetratricopeptide (TPR) repeat protein
MRSENNKSLSVCPMMGFESVFSGERASAARAGGCTGIYVQGISVFLLLGDGLHSSDAENEILKLACRAMRITFLTMFALLAVMSSCAACEAAENGLALPPNTTAIIRHIYSGRMDLAIPEAHRMQEQNPDHPLGYILEAEARWWKIWWGSAEFKYGINMARHREKTPADQPYLDLAAKAYVVATANLATHESAEMRLYAGMADALAARLYGLRAEGHNTARVGVRARENVHRALALDPELADAYFVLGLYNYYVDTLSGMARVLRFVMGIPGGTKAEGVRELQQAIGKGQLTPPLARFYLATNLHNFDQHYEEALQVMTPLREEYPENPLFHLAQGDLYAKLGRKRQALEEYRAAAACKVPDEECREKIDRLVRQSEAAIGEPGLAGGR